MTRHGIITSVLQIGKIFSNIDLVMVLYNINELAYYFGGGVDGPTFNFNVLGGFRVEEKKRNTKKTGAGRRFMWDCCWGG